MALTVWPAGLIEDHLIGNLSIFIFLIYETPADLALAPATAC